MARRYTAAKAAEIISEELDDESTNSSDSSEDENPEEVVSVIVHTSSSSSSDSQDSSDSESESSDEEGDEEIHFKARSGRIWNRNPPTQIRTPTANILRQQQGVTRAGRVQNVLSAFQLFVSDEILYIIVRETNRYALQYFARKANAGESSKWTDIDIIELKAAIGLLIHAGREKSGYRSLQEQ